MVQKDCLKGVGVARRCGLARPGVMDILTNPDESRMNLGEYEGVCNLFRNFLRERVAPPSLPNFGEPGACEVRRIALLSNSVNDLH